MAKLARNARRDREAVSALFDKLNLEQFIPCERARLMRGSCKRRDDIESSHPVALLFIEAWNFSANSASSSAARSLTAQKFSPPSLQLLILKP